MTLGSHGAASHERPGVFGFSGEPCTSAGAGTARFCAAEVYINDVALLNCLSGLRTNVSGTMVQLSTLQADVAVLETAAEYQASASDAQAAAVAAQASELAKLTATAASQAE